MNLEVSQITAFNSFLQSCISPMVLVSGVGLLLLSITNRLGRTIDRTRTVVAELERAENKHKEKDRLQLVILYKRCKILRLSVVFVALSILSASLIIPMLLTMNMLHINLQLLAMSFFGLSVLGIVMSSGLFLMDVVMTLQALRYEVEEHLTAPAVKL